MQNIHIVTVATKPGGYLKWLEESCIRNGTKLIILGMGTEWKGYIMKNILVNEYLQSVPENDIVCVIDAYDVLMVQHIDKLKEKFLNITENTDYKMICALDPLFFGELSKWYFNAIHNNSIHNNSIHNNSIHNNSKHNIVINAGTYIGYANYLKKLYTWTLDKYNNDNSLKDDQLLLNTYYEIFHNNIYIDNQNKFFLCEATLIHQKKKRDYVFLHRVANVDMVSSLIEYNYNIRIDEIIELKKKEIPYFINKSMDHIRTAIQKIIKK